MTNILDTPSQNIIDDLQVLKSDLDLKLPPKKLEKNILISTWNIRAFGDITRKPMSSGNDSPKWIFCSN